MTEECVTHDSAQRPDYIRVLHEELDAVLPCADVLQ